MPSGTSLGGTTWLSRSMEVQCKLLLENRIDDPPRRKLLKVPILRPLLSTGATFNFCFETIVDLLKQCFARMIMRSTRDHPDQK
jgi:hypothetical protein